MTQPLELDLDEAMRNFALRYDESYAIHTADMVWDAIKEQYPDLWKDYVEEEL